jgi:hypothetical protein
MINKLTCFFDDALTIAVGCSQKRLLEFRIPPRTWCLVRVIFAAV